MVAGTPRLGGRRQALGDVIDKHGHRRSVLP
jgi:hypothetical protein